MFTFVRLVRQRIRDMGTIKALLLTAERYANADGQKEPGAEHVVLSALALPDGTARKALHRIQADPERFQDAIAQQYREALENLGINAPRDADLDEARPLSPGKAYRVQASAQALMERLRTIVENDQRQDVRCPLLSAHVLQAAGAAEFGVAVRALRVMGVEPADLIEAAKTEVTEYRTGQR